MAEVELVIHEPNTAIYKVMSNLHQLPLRGDRMTFRPSHYDKKDTEHPYIVDRLEYVLDGDGLPTHVVGVRVHLHGWAEAK